MGTSKKTPEDLKSRSQERPLDPPEEQYESEIDRLQELQDQWNMTHDPNKDLEATKRLVDIWKAKQKQQ